MSPIPPRGPFHRFGFPRVSGDEPGISDSATCLHRFSPRERG